MASIYKEGTGYAARVRLNRKSAYKAGFRTKAAAQAWVRETEMAFLGAHQQMKGFGPMGTTLALALRQYAEDFVSTKRGAKVELTRMNPYFAAVGMPTLRAVAFANPAPVRTTHDSASVRHFELVELPPDGPTLPRTFEKYRQARLDKRPNTATMRAQLASMLVGRIAPHHIQSLVTAMKKDGLTTSTINNELSILSTFFEKAKSTWLWEPLTNPVKTIKRETPDNRRDRVLGDHVGEEQALADALRECKNPYVSPFVWLSIETAMRKSESLMTAHWEDVNWDKRILHLARSKTGKRDVPLTRAAVELLKNMPGRDEGGAIFKTTADAIDSAWERACARAGIKNLRIHDLRHTAATRHCARLSGDIFSLKLITGHKTLQMLARYVKSRPEEVIERLDATEPPTHPALISPDHVGKDADAGRPTLERRVGNVRVRVI